MKKFVLVTVFAALALVVSTAFGKTQFDRMNPKVDVVGGKIVVDQETIRFKAYERDVWIVWQLPNGSNYQFAPIDGKKDGIKIKGDQQAEFKCRVEASGKRFACKNAHSKSCECKYTINLIGTPKVLPLDPIIIND